MPKLLNSKFGISNTLKFITEPDGLSYVCIANESATAKISLHGAQILSFQPRHKENILWVSKKSLFVPDNAIRGGIPICWPWFGSHPNDSTKKPHGFARLSEWSVTKTEALDTSTTQITLELHSTDKTKDIWLYDFIVTLTITISNKLNIALTTHNTGNKPFTITSALHTYLNISHIAQITIHGLENSLFLDTLNNQEKTEDSPISINQEIDRVYLEHSADCLIKDSGLQRTIRIAKQGSNSTVVWNPWIEKSKHMSDFGDDEYKTMLCVETTNALTDTIEVKPDKVHTLSATISLD